MDTILKSYNTIFVDFGNAYTLSQIKNLASAKAVLLGYEDFPLTHELMAQAIMGGLSIDGKIPVESTKLFKRNSGVETRNPIRLKIAYLKMQASHHRNFQESTVWSTMLLAQEQCRVVR